MKPVLFSDLDGTLCFHEEAHGVRVVGPALVEEPGGRRYQCHDVSTSSYKIWVAEETLSLLRALRSRYQIVLVTGGRPSTVERRRAHFDFAEAFVLENGGLICDADFQPHRGWHERLEPERRLLPQVVRSLTAAGWRLDAEGRNSAVRVRLRDNPDRSAGEFAALCRDVVLPPGLRKTINLENLDVILAGAGKESAVRFWMAERGLDAAASVGIGDDLNDIEFLRATGAPYVLASAYPAVLAEARRVGWRISSAGHFTGINEILRGLAGTTPPSVFQDPLPRTPACKDA